MRSVPHLKGHGAIAVALCLGCIVAIAVVSRSRPTELLQRQPSKLQQKPAGHDWLGSVINKALGGLSDTKLVDGQQLAAAAGPEAFGGARIRHAKPVVHSRLNKLGVKMEQWPWDKGAHGAVQSKDSIIDDLKTAFSDLPHANRILTKTQRAALKTKNARAMAAMAATAGHKLSALEEHEEAPAVEGGEGEDAAAEGAEGAEEGAEVPGGEEAAAAEEQPWGVGVAYTGRVVLSDLG